MAYIQRSLVLVLLILLAPAVGFTENNQIVIATDSGAVMGIENSDSKVSKGTCAWRNLNSLIGSQQPRPFLAHNYRPRQGQPLEPGRRTGRPVSL